MKTDKVQALAKIERVARGNRLATYRLSLAIGLIGCFMAVHAAGDAEAAAAAGVQHSAELQESLQAELRALGDDYQPRTEHLNDDGSPVYINRLVREESPYLLQHAHNPVDWYPWGAEAFEKAKLENKPVFLSIGYATCHWCHVMERESFENEAIARQLNEHYVPIKVDREQLPDVDATYMMAVQLLTGSGGWPMSNFLQPDAKPFHAGTYMPPNVFSDTLENIRRVWAEDRDRVQDVAVRLSDAVGESTRLRGEVRDVGLREITRARDSALEVHDDLQGGFGPAPKFTREPTLFFLLELAQRNGDKEALEAVDFSLRRMAAGGIHDQVGGGFHRYAVDDDWLTPHFEKMLYSQAALARVYLQAYQLTGNKQHVRTTRRMLDYVLREMTSPEGGFYSATDADSEGEEGIFFTWTKDQLTEVLGKADAELATSVWGVTEQGNFEGRNILHTQGSLAEIAPDTGLSVDELTDRLSDISGRLLTERVKRIPPLTDDKIISEWNGMMITAFAQAGEALNEPRYIDAAIRAAEFIWSSNRQDDGGLWRAHFGGKSSIAASQPDYAFMAEAMLELYDVTGQNVWIERVLELNQHMYDRFWDSENGGYFIGAAITSGAPLPTRPKDMFDNSTPTGNSVALRVLTRLWHRTGEEKYRERAQAVLGSFSTYFEMDSSGFGYLLVGASELLNGESGHRQYSARGKVRVNAAAVDGSNIKVKISIAPGWHINAEEPLQDYLIGTRLTQVNDEPLAGVNYPESETRVLGFQRSALALYEGEVTLTAPMPEPAADGIVSAVALQLQACSDEICLAPETLTLPIPRAEL